MTKQDWLAVACVTLLPVLIGVLVSYEVVVWRECLAAEPWWYCLRVLGK